MEKDNERIIIEQYNGIIPFHEAFYIQSIGLAALRGIEAFDRYAEKIQSNKDPVSLIYDLQAALTHAAAVSRFFWTASRNPLNVARAARLRWGYGVSDDDPLSDRRLRNAIEHFDERLDKFLSNDPTGPVVDMVVGDHRLADEQLGHVLRLIDPVAGIFVLLGEKYEFVGIESNLRTISDTSASMASQGFRLKRPEPLLRSQQGKE